MTSLLRSQEEGLGNNMLLTLVKTHFKKFYREPGIMFWAIIFPIIMSWLLGIAFDKKGQPPHLVGVLGQSTEISLEAIQKAGTLSPLKDQFKFIALPSKEEAISKIKKGEINLFLDASNNTVHLDPKNSIAVTDYLAYEHARQAVIHADQTPISPLSETGSRYIDFLLPGLMAMGILSSCLWGTGWSLIDLRMKKMLRRMMATPLPKSTFLISHLLTRIILSGFETALLYLFAHFYFDMPLSIHWGAFWLLFLAANISFSGISILMASRADNPIVGNGLLNAILMPMLFLSGVFFSYHNYPGWMLPVIEKLPLTLLADGFRRTMIEGGGLHDAIQPCLWLLGYGVISFVGGLKLFKWN
jgi:ABC-2 type transport system permease protein